MTLQKTREWYETQSKRTKWYLYLGLLWRHCRFVLARSIIVWHPVCGPKWQYVGKSFITLCFSFNKAKLPLLYLPHIIFTATKFSLKVNGQPIVIKCSATIFVSRPDFRPVIGWGRFWNLSFIYQSDQRSGIQLEKWV